MNGVKVWLARQVSNMEESKRLWKNKRRASLYVSPWAQQKCQLFDCELLQNFQDDVGFIYRKEKEAKLEDVREEVSMNHVERG